MTEEMRIALDTLWKAQADIAAARYGILREEDAKAKAEAELAEALQRLWVLTT